MPPLTIGAIPVLSLTTKCLLATATANTEIVGSGGQPPK
jgi:hypothetical protein